MAPEWRKSPDHIEAFMHFPSERRVELVIAGLIDATDVGSNRSAGMVDQHEHLYRRVIGRPGVAPADGGEDVPQGMTVDA